MSGVNSKAIAVSMVCVLALSGCKTLEEKFASMDTCDWTVTSVGAVAGGVAGMMLLGGEGRVLGAMAGAALGGFLGSQLAEGLDCHDKKAAATASIVASDVPVGQPVIWATDGAKVDPAKIPKVPAAKPATAKATQSAKSKKKEAAPQVASVAPPKRTEEQKEAVKLARASLKQPLPSEGKSNRWGAVVPLTELTRTPDGQMCRDLQFVVYEADGQQVSEGVTSNCLDAESRWQITWTPGYVADKA